MTALPAARRGFTQSTRWPSIGVVVAYGVAALAANWPTWPGDPHVIRQGDASFLAWCLAWTPYALAHGHNLFATNLLNFPSGIDLAQNTAVPLLGLLAAPITLVAGPIASLNLLAWLAFPLSASSAYFVLRRLGCSDLGAFAGGAFYGFSPYMVGQGVNLPGVVVPLPPLILWALYELCVRRERDPLRWGALLGVLVVAQYLVAAEICATTCVIGACAMAVLAVAHPGEVRPAIAHGARGLALAVAIVSAGLAYPLWMALSGPLHASGTPPGSGLSADLLATVVPNANQLLGTAGLKALGDRLVAGDIPENGSYLGIPLFIALLAICRVYWRDPWVRTSAVMAAVALVLSLGPHLVVDATRTSIPLPAVVLARLPVLRNMAEVRLSLYVALFVAVLIARGVTHAELARSAARRGAGDGGRTGRRPGALRLPGGAVALLAECTVLSLLPGWPYATHRVGVPAYFAEARLDRIPAGAVVLFSPYPSYTELGPELWQAVAGMRFAIVGGYGIFTSSSGTMDVFPATLQPAAVERFVWSASTRAYLARVGAGAPVPDLVVAVREFVAHNHITAAVDAGNRRVDRLFVAAFGPPSSTAGGVHVWYHV